MQETSSVKLINCSNWIHNDRKIVFPRQIAWLGERVSHDQLLPAGSGNRDLLRGIRHKVINTGWPLIKTTNTHFPSEQRCRKKPVCHLLCMGLQGLLDLFQDPAHHQDEHNSPAMFRLTRVLCGKMKSHHSFQYSWGASAGLPSNKVEPGSIYIIRPNPTTRLDLAIT